MWNLAAQVIGIEWIIILIVIAILLLFGPSKIPELARAFGRAWGEFRRGKTEVERELREGSATLEEKERRG